MNHRLFTRQLWFLVIGAFLVGCSTSYRYVHVSDAAIRGNELVFLLYAQSGVRQHALFHHGSPTRKLRGAVGIGVCRLDTDEAPVVRLVGARDASHPPILRSTYDLVSTGSCLVPTETGLLKVEIRENIRSDTFVKSSDPSEYLQTPSRRFLIVCEGEQTRVFDADADTMGASQIPQSFSAALCRSRTNYSMGPILAVSDDLKAFALRDVNLTDAMSVWNLLIGPNPRMVPIPDRSLRLEAVQLINGKAWILFSDLRRTTSKAVLMDEDGRTLAETETFGSTPIVDSDFGRVIFLAQTAKSIRIKIWNPMLGREKVFDIPDAEVSRKLYSVWDSTPSR